MASRHLKKHRSRRLRQGRSPGCEPLESRRLLAVDVAAPMPGVAVAHAADATGAPSGATGGRASLPNHNGAV